MTASVVCQEKTRWCSLVLILSKMWAFLSWRVAELFFDREREYPMEGTVQCSESKCLDALHCGLNNDSRCFWAACGFVGVLVGVENVSWVPFTTVLLTLYRRGCLLQLKPKMYRLKRLCFTSFASLRFFTHRPFLSFALFPYYISEREHNSSNTDKSVSTNLSRKGLKGNLATNLNA